MPRFYVIFALFLCPLFSCTTMFHFFSLDATPHMGLPVVEFFMGWAGFGLFLVCLGLINFLFFKYSPLPPFYLKKISRHFWGVNRENHSNLFMLFLLLPNRATRFNIKKGAKRGKKNPVFSMGWALSF